ncbi:MAG: trehalose-6-phosphate synthase [Candidatus Margulisbacteria bacterium]|nr:trehalose-6-phosphate synthase [Candidatus Margulisiibacteriota bacterium]
MCTKEELKELVAEKLRENLFVVVSNREPYIHKFTPEGVECSKPASGLVTALDSVLQSCGGIWVAHGSGEADKKVVDKNDRIQVPPEDPRYTLKRIWLSKEEEAGYYYGLSNQTLWPLCHIVYQKPVFSRSDWEQYKKVNEKFAQSILEEVKGKNAFVFIQDFHLTLLPKLLKDADPNIKVAHFWHIPWPNPEAFRICPWKQEILEGLLGADLLGFHIGYHTDNFLDTINQVLEAKVDKVASSVVYGGHETLVKAFPIGVDFEKISRSAVGQKVEKNSEFLKKQLNISNIKYVGVGADRIDYTKGIPERFAAIDRLLEKYPHYQGNFVFLQVGALSRIHIQAYKNLNDEINSLVERINWKYSSDGWIPIVMMRRHFTPEDLMSFYRMSDFCICSSLHDGMNLVCKEFVSAARDETSLLLSRFTGAARELADSVLINPYDPESFADAINQSLCMSNEEKAKRVAKMKESISENNIYKWAASIIRALLKIA